MTRQVLLYSGGMDSFIAAYMNPGAMLLHVDTRARYSEKEMRNLRNGLPQDRRVFVDRRLDLSDVERPDLIVPARNLFLVAIASFHGEEILLVATAGDKSTDKDAMFAELAGGLLTHMYGSHHFPGHPGCQVLLPYKNHSKAQMVYEYLLAGGDPQALANTVSCYHPTLQHCGCCKACLRKWVALKVHNLHNLTRWAMDPASHDWAPIVAQIKEGGWRCPQEDEDTLVALGLKGPTPAAR